jgi:hypothetical protein
MKYSCLVSDNLWQLLTVSLFYNFFVKFFESWSLLNNPIQSPYKTHLPYLIQIAGEQIAMLFLSEYYLIT